MVGVYGHRDKVSAQGLMGFRVWGSGGFPLCMGRSARGQGGLPKDQEYIRVSQADKEGYVHAYQAGEPEGGALGVSLELLALGF